MPRMQIVAIASRHVRLESGRRIGAFNNRRKFRKACARASFGCFGRSGSMRSRRSEAGYSSDTIGHSCGPTHNARIGPDGVAPTCDANSRLASATGSPVRTARPAEVTQPSVASPRVHGHHRHVIARFRARLAPYRPASRHFRAAPTLAMVNNVAWDTLYSRHICMVNRLCRMGHDHCAEKGRPPAP